MKTNLRIGIILLFLLAILALASTACSKADQNLTLEEIVERYSQEMKDVKSVQVNAEITAKAPGLEITAKAEGLFEAPEKGYLTAEVAGQKFELLVLSQTEVYVKMPGETTWTAVPLDQMQQMDHAEMNPEALGMSVEALKLLKLSNFMTNIQEQADEKIVGVDCYHLTMEIDLKIFAGLLEKQLPDEAMQALAQPIYLDLWVGKSDMLVHKLVATMDMQIQEAEYSFVVTATISKYNEPVTFPQP